jgi:hypothetical protein
MTTKYDIGNSLYALNVYTDSKYTPSIHIVTITSIHLYKDVIEYGVSENDEEWESSVPENQLSHELAELTKHLNL